MGKENDFWLVMVFTVMACVVIILATINEPIYIKEKHNEKVIND